MATYKIDPMHSEITFKVKHLMITNVTGSFQQFDATLEAEADERGRARLGAACRRRVSSSRGDERQCDGAHDGRLKADDPVHAATHRRGMRSAPR